MPDPVKLPISTVVDVNKPVLSTVSPVSPVFPVGTNPVVTLPVAPVNPLPTNPVVTGPVLTGPVVTVPTNDGSTALSPTNPKITTTAPTSSVSVTVPNTSGQVTFSLVVTDNLGVVSQPSTITVNIQNAPVAVIRAASQTVAAGAPIQLSGADSTSSGSIASFTFSLVTPS